MAKKNKKKQRIRPLALCVFRRDDKIFVAEGYDAHLDQVFYRPIGGRIEFGESGHEAVIREVKEEINANVTEVKYLGMLENIFEYEGESGHEIVLVYDGGFVDDNFNDDQFSVIGKDAGEVLYEGRWMRLDAFRADDTPPLYPSGLLELLDAGGSPKN